MDLGRRWVVELLPDRSRESLADWLRRHPELEVTTRDRLNTYRETLAAGAPDAVQLADRWHLLHNLTMILEGWTPMPFGGGHFAAAEEPELLARDIAAFFAGS